jgi:hypothetical protein
MEKLMNHIVLKLVLCTGIFCGTNFGMEKEQAVVCVPQQIVLRMPQKQLYIEHDYTAYSYYGNDKHVVQYRKINEFGSYFEVKSSTQSKIESAIKFKCCYLVLQNQQYYVKAGADYSLSIVAKNKNVLDPDLVPVQFTRSQLAGLIRLIDEKEKKVFILDGYGHRLDIIDVSRSIALDIEGSIRPQVRQNYGYGYNAHNHYVADDTGCIIS